MDQIRAKILDRSKRIRLNISDRIIAIIVERIEKSREG